jgi:hypothetical protein
MVPIRLLTVCVDYDDLLRLTLWANARHATECWVVTTPADDATRAVCASVPSCRVLETDAFYRGGAKFNKGAAVEECFDAMGRTGWIAIVDADIVLPDVLPLEGLRTDTLYSAPRRFLDDPSQYRPGTDWSRLPLGDDRSYPGYLHLFHADAPCLRARPWYDTRYTHAGGCDARFETLFGPKKHKLPFEVLHLGPRDVNWMGRVSMRSDSAPIPEAADRRADMEAFRAAKGWGRPRSGTFDEIVRPG